MQHEINTFNIKTLFTTSKYRIPIYQRNYAWGRSEISQLIQDIIDYIPEKRNYYIGTLVVFERNEKGTHFFDTIDGQQRLTTFSILLSVLQNEYKVIDWFKENLLSFESRPLSQNGLDFSFSGFFDSNKDYHNTIKEAYDHIILDIKNKLEENQIMIADFVHYLCEYVTILQVEVPYDTDLNHYFEIMNNRGEQLEKHEVVKSMLLDCLYDEEDINNKHLLELFHVVWDAVSNMERYVQFGFEPKLRRKLFGKDWTTLQLANVDELQDVFLKYNINGKTKELQELTVEEIIVKGRFNIKENVNETPDRFTSPVNFQNFLLQLLRVYTKNKETTLDDKKLIYFFKNEIKRSGLLSKEFALQFMFQMLNGKYLLDKYVLKRQFLANKEGWSVLTLKSNDGKKGFYVNTFGDEANCENEIIVMLLSMFHVSTPTMIYKHWLNAVLYYLIDAKEINVNNYQLYLEKFAKDLVCFRFLNRDSQSKLDYYTLIYENHFLLEEYPIITDDNMGLIYGSIENNLVFNFLDYIIWLNDKTGKFSSFEFSFRSSVEHYYPQNPIGGRKLEDEKALHSFGNLCLISHQKNSKLNHHLPTAKRNYYAKLNQGGQLAYDSLKQYVMMNNYNSDTWSETDIYEHNQEVVAMFNGFIQNN
ncbi:MULTISPECIES: DUF262 domain-containing protein [Sphingobacterium]|uniref:GmrSD restriction endonuclease domain-containing protein n=1 Tax=Sphingobacterium TaxID=28453 RepID=UPI001042C583|nr:MULTISPECIES: DUF262 domain-containing protein [Sphingobacterium]MCW2258675.1 uncharacterized protein with ParB-like and HNH nuclease domain [Sphingobacterium kitahiroshimense]TCR14869.1 uncharacterized protein with ParB-like and HNH nuclease domain [Sphingobacterium sp. JUb78]